MLRIDNDKIRESRDNVEDDLRDAEKEISVLTIKERDLEIKFDTAQRDNHYLKEENIRMSAQKENIEQRLFEREKEIERLRGELSMMDRMISRNDNSYPSQYKPPHQQWQQHELRHNNYIDPLRDREVQNDIHPPRHMRNHSPAFDSPRFESPESRVPARRPNDPDIGSNEDMQEYARRNVKNENNIFTWGNPYSKADNSRFQINPAGPTTNPRDRIPRQDLHRHEVEQPEEAPLSGKLRRIPRRARPTNPTMFKLEHEMTDGERQKKDLDAELLQLQVTKDKVSYIDYN